MNRLLTVFAVLGLSACGANSDPACRFETYAGNAYTICVAPVDADIRVFLNRPNGNPYYSFEAVDTALAGQGERLVFGMNAGMYHQNRAPVGLYVEDGVTHTPLNTVARDGNFGLVPNGVFYIADGRAGLAETSRFARAAPNPSFATQSGPMLVIDGKLHPKFQASGPSKKKRNGVGITGDGRRVYFVVSEVPVNFHSFASLFRDHLDTPNALFLDGTVSRLYDRETARSDAGLPMGPMVGLVMSGQP